VSGDDLVDNLLTQVLLDLLVGDLVVVLGGDHDGVHAERGEGASHTLVLHSHLGLAVGAHPGAHAVLAHLRQLVANAVGEQVGEGHGLLRLVRGVPKHNSLVSRTNVLGGTGLGILTKHTLGNVGGLGLQGHEHAAGLVVKALGLVVVANVLHGSAHYGLIVDLGLGGDLTKHHHHASLGCSLAGDLAAGGGKEGKRLGVGKIVRNGLAPGASAHV